MLQTSDGETEILLGNKQLVGIFFLVAILLGIAFGGGYMIGRGAAEKKPVTAIPAATDTANPTPTNASGGETRTVSPSDTAVPDQKATDTSGANPEPPPLGARKRNEPKEKPATSAPAPATPANGGFAPRSGETFLQVTAVGRDEAIGVADVLRKKGFHAHAVPVPGSSNMYRVIVGPVKDAGDLASTRDELRKTGFGKVFVQHY
jgi:cell division septation protein DedD